FAHPGVSWPPAEAQERWVRCLRYRGRLASRHVGIPERRPARTGLSAACLTCRRMRPAWDTTRGRLPLQGLRSGADELAPFLGARKGPHMHDPSAQQGWYYKAEGETLGPVSALVLQELLASSRLHGHQPVWRQDGESLYFTTAAKAAGTPQETQLSL